MWSAIATRAGVSPRRNMQHPITKQKPSLRAPAFCRTIVLYDSRLRSNDRWTSSEARPKSSGRPKVAASARVRSRSFSLRLSSRGELAEKNESSPSWSELSSGSGSALANAGVATGAVVGCSWLVMAVTAVAARCALNWRL